MFDFLIHSPVTYYARTTPDHPAFSCKGAELSYAELEGVAQEMAQIERRSSLGVLAGGIAGCGNGSEDSLVVSAAASVGPALEVVADAFEDRARGALDFLNKNWAANIDIPKERVFVGLDAYQRAIDCGVDMVIMASRGSEAHFDFGSVADRVIKCTSIPTVIVPV